MVSNWSEVFSIWDLTIIATFFFPLCPWKYFRTWRWTDSSPPLAIQFGLLISRCSGSSEGEKQGLHSGLLLGEATCRAPPPGATKRTLLLKCTVAASLLLWLPYLLGIQIGLAESLWLAAAQFSHSGKNREGWTRKDLWKNFPEFMGNTIKS